MAQTPGVTSATHRWTQRSADRTVRLAIMKAHVLPEPELELRAGNRHVDPPHGVAVLGTYYLQRRCSHDHAKS